MKTFRILLVKETKAQEQRVALIPTDVASLIQQGHTIAVEHNAGLAAGYSDQDYQNAGASIRYFYLENNTPNLDFFADIDWVVRVKRADRMREKWESQHIPAGTYMLGALDPLEKNSSHIAEYHQAKIIPYSIDQLNFPAGDPINILTSMSKIAGKLALLDAIDKFNGTPKAVVIIGFGVVGQAAFAEALAQKLDVTLVLSHAAQQAKIAQLHPHVHTILFNKTDHLLQQQQLIQKIVQDTDLVITSARAANQVAPLLIPAETLALMHPGSVIVDMALSEGGNVAGSSHDATHTLGKGVLVTNTSGYPKAMPYEASILWSAASHRFITLFAENPRGLESARC